MRAPKSIFTPQPNDAPAPRTTADRLDRQLATAHSHPHLHVPSTPKPTREGRDHAPSSSSNGNSSTPADNQFKSFKVSLEDPCWKVLPAALKKYKINDDWKKYVMFICHGSTGTCFEHEIFVTVLTQRLQSYRTLLEL